MSLGDLVTADTDVVGRKELITAGCSDAEIAGAQRVGQLHRLIRGYYAATTGFADLTVVERQRMRARAAGRRSPSAVVSHVSAAALWGMPLWDALLTRVHLTKPGPGGSRVRGGVQLHAAMLGDHDVRALDGIRLTSPARTIVDVGRSCGIETALIATDFVLHNRLATPREIRTALEQSRHRPGMGAARRAILFADGRSESPGETRVRLALHRAGLPAPDLQFDIFDDDHVLIGRADLGYIDDGVIMEFDGRLKYGDAGNRPGDALAQEKAREDALRELGWVVARFVWSDFGDPQRLADRAQTALERGRAVIAHNSLSGYVSRRPAVKVTPWPVIGARQSP